MAISPEPVYSMYVSISPFISASWDMNDPPRLKCWSTGYPAFSSSWESISPRIICSVKLCDPTLIVGLSCAYAEGAPATVAAVRPAVVVPMSFRRVMEYSTGRNRLSCRSGTAWSYTASTIAQIRSVLLASDEALFLKEGGGNVWHLL